jgi:hypothetical protein
MKQHQIQLKSFTVSDRCRTYSYQVIDPSGDTRQFTVEVSLELFRTSPLKFQDGPLITRELLLVELEREAPGLLAHGQLNVSEPDILGYMERHYPPKARTWNHYKPAAAANE